MGKLAVEGGFYGRITEEPESRSSPWTSRTFCSTIFRLVSSSAVWAAPEFQMGTSQGPNIFVIREIDVTDTENYLASANILPLPKERLVGRKETLTSRKVFGANTITGTIPGEGGGVHETDGTRSEFLSNYTNLRDAFLPIQRAHPCQRVWR